MSMYQISQVLNQVLNEAQRTKPKLTTEINNRNHDYLEM
jgi:hypothetical protein